MNDPPFFPPLRMFQLYKSKEKQRGKKEEEERDFILLHSSLSLF